MSRTRRSRMAPGMTVRAITPWFGGKRTMAPDIVLELGPHTQYFEPFCGSMAVLFAKDPCQKETVNDLHGDLINLARVVQDIDQAEQLYTRLQQTLVCEGIVDDAKRELQATSISGERDLDRAYWYFLACWQCRNGTAGTKRVDYQTAVRWTKSGGSPTVRFYNAVESLPWWHRRLRNVVILKRDAFSILTKFEDIPETAIYADPPYASESRSGHRQGPGSSNKYLHELDHKATLWGNDHVRLRDDLAKYKRARVVVSYYDCPQVRELYAGWTIIEHTRLKFITQQSGRGQKALVAPEILIINGLSYAGAV